MRLLVLLALLISVPTALGASNTYRTQLVGHVVLAAQEPNCSQTGCSPPAKLLTIHLRPTTGHVRTAQTDTTGTFRIKLRPGVYKVSTPTTAADPSARIQPARIVIKRTTTVRIKFIYLLNR